MRKHTTSLKELIDNMLRANLKAIEFSEEYNRQVALLKDRVYNEKIYGKVTQDEAIILDARYRSLKEKSLPIQDAFAGYSFWKGEVERISAVLQGLHSFWQLTGLSPTTQDYSIYT